MGERKGGNPKIFQKSLATTLNRLFGLAEAGTDKYTWQQALAAVFFARA